MKSALAILGETGRTDFTVLEVVERSKTSLRSFYQHFSTKDELLLALIDKIMAESTQKWRDETTGLASTAALRLLIDRICAPAESSTQDSINRGLTFYNDHLAETLPREYARVLSPLHQLIQDILNRGIAEGTFRADLDVDATAALIMQTVLGAMRLRVLGVELNGVPIDAIPHLRVLHERALRTTATPSDLRMPDVHSVVFQGGRLRWSRSGNVITAREQQDSQETLMPSRELSFPVFDADNHMYEPQEALTKFLPDKRKNAIDYVQVRGRTKIVVRGHISDYIPNPTFEVVARPGAQEEYFRHGTRGQELPRDDGRADEGDPRVPRAGRRGSRSWTSSASTTR